jgi:two-component system response regulator AtoC
MDSLHTNRIQVPISSIFVNGQGRALQHLNETLSEIARTDVPVLIVGESGTGKDAYAKQIHRLSKKNELRFQKLSCASLDPNILSRALRPVPPGQEWTDSCGTLYLDNIQDSDLATQRTLLTCLAEDEDTDSKSGDVARLISSATFNLESEVRLGYFRRELYFRLNGVCLRIPPLRERLEDIPFFMEHFLHSFSCEFKKNTPELNQEVVDTLSAYHWPGNIRELENIARRIVLFGDFRIVMDELQFSIPEQSGKVSVVNGSSLKMAARAASKKAERELIMRTLERTRWNRKKAARELQISYKSLLCKIKQIGVPDSKHED